MVTPPREAPLSLISRQMDGMFEELKSGDAHAPAPLACSSLCARRTTSLITTTRATEANTPRMQVIFVSLDAVLL